MKIRYYDELAGKKGWFIWNLSALGDDPASTSAGIVAESGCQFVAVKGWDGDEPYDQPMPPDQWRYLLPGTRGYRLGVWGYHYGRQPQAELDAASECIRQTLPDFVILNVEDPAVETNPRTARLWADALRHFRKRHPRMPIYFCSHAQPDYHPRQPYWQALQAGCLQQPMIYHTAMEMPPRDAVAVSIDQFTGYSLLTHPQTGARLPWSAAGAAYGSDEWPITREGMGEWADQAVEQGATSLIWWAMDEVPRHPELAGWVGEIPRPPARPRP